jgi:DNA-binding MarR family transcriptional regulator
LRHEISGFDIEFVKPDIPTLVRIRHPIESSDALRNPRDEYFERLGELTQGNPLLALLYWLETTRVSDSDDSRIIVDPLPEREMNLVETLSLDKKLILSTLVQHSALSVSQLSRVLRTDVNTVKTELAHLRRLGFVEHITSTANYRLRDFPAVLVTQAFREMNLV